MHVPTLLTTVTLCTWLALPAAAQSVPDVKLQPSPPGQTAIQVGGSWVKSDDGQRYEGGKWIVVDYSRPMLKGRTNIFGSGAEYGKAAYAEAPVWRAGANDSTRLKSSIPLVIGTTTVPAGEYSVFIELNSPTQWTFIVTTWAQARFGAPVSEGLYGAFTSTQEKDVVRAPMRVDTLPYQVEQLTWAFTDMTATGGRMAIMWDKTMGSVPFSFGR